MNPQERIKELEEQLKKTQYNKATEKYFGIIMSQIARLRERIEKQQAKQKVGIGFAVKKSGDATAVLLGFPSVGKSTLLNALTGAKSRVAGYEFTTLDVVPGVLKHHGAKIQILDIPGIIYGASEGKGRGREVLGVVRSSDIIIILVDAGKQLDTILRELKNAGIRLNQKPPDVKISKTAKGGIQIASTAKLSLSEETLKSVLNEFRIINAVVVFRENVDIERLIDAIEANRVYISSVVVVTKADAIGRKELEKIMRETKADIAVSAEKGVNVGELKELIFNRLSFIRIFLKEAGKKADLEEPMVLRKGATLRNVCERIHRDFVRKFRFAKVWGKSAKFPGQQFHKLDKALEDGDVVEVRVK